MRWSCGWNELIRVECLGYFYTSMWHYLLPIISLPFQTEFYSIWSSLGLKFELIDQNIPRSRRETNVREKVIQSSDFRVCLLAFSSSPCNWHCLSGGYLGGDKHSRILPTQGGGPQGFRDVLSRVTGDLGFHIPPSPLWLFRSSLSSLFLQ